MRWATCVGFIEAGFELEQLHRLAGRIGGKKGLGLALPVMGDQMVGGGENGLGAAEVLGQRDHLGIGKVLLEIEDVANVRAAPFVNRLIGVADHAQVGMVDATGSGRRHTGPGWCPDIRR